MAPCGVAGAAGLGRGCGGIGGATRGAAAGIGYVMAAGRRAGRDRGRGRLPPFPVFFAFPIFRGLLKGGTPRAYASSG